MVALFARRPRVTVRSVKRSLDKFAGKVRDVQWGN